MAGLIRRSDIDEVRSRTNIADIVGDYVTLKSAGVGSMKGLCPFHDERTPSFHVRPQVGFYHCFGCGEGGDVFTFLQRMDHTTFSEAVERLAARIGYELHYEDGGGPAREHGNRARLLAANRAAEQFFIEQLLTADAAPARQFLGQRGFDPAAAERFGVGYAPKSFSALSKALMAQGFTENELVAAGLLSSGERGSYDRFRGRVVWPIRDVTGQTLGFGARRLFDDDQGPKYLNTPDTAVYHKSQVLYGLDLAKRDIARGKRVVIVEGYTDVMACHLAGVTTAVATCGTAFGVDHIKIIRRVLGDYDTADTGSTGEVVFTFDPDEAGQKAASRAFAEEQRFAARTYVATPPEGLDPCDLRLERGDDAVRQLIAGRRPMFEFMLRRALGEHDLDTVEGRVAALRQSAPIVAGIRDRALAVGYARTLAKWLGMDPGEINRAVSAAGRASEARAAAGDQRSVSAGPRRDPSQSRQGPDQAARGVHGRRELGSRDVPSAPAAGGAQAMPQAAPVPTLVQLPADPVTRVERDALMAVLQHPGELGLERVSRTVASVFHNPVLAVVRDAIAASLDRFGEPDWVGAVGEEAPRAFSALVQQLSVAPLPGHAEQLVAYCNGVTAGLIERDLLRRKTELLGALQRTDAAAEPERFSQLNRDLVQLEQERRRLRED
ncbi:DNA primase [Ruicaihuangia caeni]|uniref:DNA primase n=1 Tax=Ruicaihuangia caeni TaxID=3042517 RepID=UPI003390313C